MHVYFPKIVFFLKGNGGAECEFIAAITLDNHVTLESAIAPGSHIGVLPTGQLTNPALTSKTTDASHFFVKFIVSVSIKSTIMVNTCTCSRCCWFIVAREEALSTSNVLSERMTYVYIQYYVLWVSGQMKPVEAFVKPSTINTMRITFLYNQIHGYC